MSTKKIFLERLRSRLFGRLQESEMKTWDISDIWNFSQAVINENKGKIDVYLENNPVTLKNINEAIDEIIDKILFPAIKIE